MSELVLVFGVIGVTIVVMLGVIVMFRKFLLQRAQYMAEEGADGGGSTSRKPNAKASARTAPPPAHRAEQRSAAA